MAGFVLLAVALSGVALVFVLPVFVRRKAGEWQEDGRRTDNIIAGRERLRSLRESADAGGMSEAQLEEHTREIERQLLDDVYSDSPATVSPAGGGGQRERLGAVVVLVVLLLMPAGFYWLTGAPAALSPTVQSGSEAPSMETIAARLRARLADDPEDAEALYWMGRLATEGGEWVAAAEYFARARQSAGDSAALLVGEINALLLTEDAQYQDRVDRLLATGLADAPDSGMFLWLAGLNAEKQGRLREALGFWERAYDRLDDEPEYQREIAAVIADVRSSLGEAADGQAGAVTVVVGNALDGQAGGTLFVFARAMGEGSPAMPLAVERRVVARWPATVVLDDSRAMTPGMRMSGFDSYRVVARLSRSGDAVAAAGDSFGEVGGVLPGTRVTVLIDRTVE